MIVKIRFEMKNVEQAKELCNTSDCGDCPFRLGDCVLTDENGNQPWEWIVEEDRMEDDLK